MFSSCRTSAGEMLCLGSPVWRHLLSVISENFGYHSPLGICPVWLKNLIIEDCNKTVVKYALRPRTMEILLPQ
jgi:hypothetical protein